MQAASFKAGETIITAGDEGDTAFVVVSGAVEVIVGERDSARIVGTLHTGEVFGEMCLIEPGPRSATVRAAEDTECLVTSYEEFISTIEDNPERAVAFMKTLVRRLRLMNAMLAKSSPPGRGLRDLVLEAKDANTPEAGTLSWTMLW